MGLTYTDKDKVILEAWGKFRVTLYEDVEAGDLLRWYNSDNNYTVRLADNSDSLPADCIALESGVDGGEIWAALKAVLGTITSQSGSCGRGIPEVIYFAADSDYFGAPLFLGESGKVSDTAGTTFNQPVGVLLARDRILLDLAPNILGSILIGQGATLAYATNGGIKVDFVLSLATVGGFNGIESNVDYEPDGGSGFASPQGVVGRVTLKTGKTFSGGQAGMEGVRGHLAFEDAAVVNQQSSILTALRGVITASGTPIFTDAEGICCLYLDNLANLSMIGLAGGYNTSMIFIANNGAYMDSAIRIKGARLNHFVYFEQCMGKSVETGGSLGGQSYNIKILVDFSGTTRVAWILAQEDRT